MAAGAVMVISAGLVLLGNRKLEKPDAQHFRDEMKIAVKAIFPKEFVIYTGIIIGYMIVLQPLHFLPSSFVFMAVSMVVLRGTGWVKSLLISAGTLVCIYIIFQYFFRVIMP